MSLTLDLHFGDLECLSQLEQVVNFLPHLLIGEMLDFFVNLFFLEAVGEDSSDWFGSLHHYFLLVQIDPLLAVVFLIRQQVRSGIPYKCLDPLQTLCKRIGGHRSPPP